MTMGCSIAKHIAAIALYFLCIGLYPISAKPEITSISAKGDLGGDSTINCTGTPENANVTWFFNEEPLIPDNRINITSIEKELGKNVKDEDGDLLKIKVSTVSIVNTTYSDAGNYTCQLNFEENVYRSTDYLDLRFEAKLINQTKSPIKIHVSDDASITLECIFEVYNETDVKWFKKGDKGSFDVTPERISPKLLNITRYIKKVSLTDNGAHVCELDDAVSGKKKFGRVDIIVYAPPTIKIEKVLGVNTTALYLEWTVDKNNLPIKSYNVFLRDLSANSTNFDMINKKVEISNNTSFLITDLKKTNRYQVKLDVITWDAERSINYTRYDISKEVETLGYDPMFVPNISINGFSATSVTIGWAAPKNDTEQYIHYYLLEARKKDENVSRKAYHSRDGRNLPYMFDSLEPHSTYVFRVRACSDYTKSCGNWSEEMEAATLDGVPSEPTDVNMFCDVYYCNVTWSPPKNPNAEIKGYSVELIGSATFLDRYGTRKNTTWGPHSKFTTNNASSTRFDKLQPNTEYTVRVSAMTRTRRRGYEATMTNKTLPHAPDSPPRPRWRKIYEDDKYLFKMFLPRVSERNGPICCYRVYMVRLQPQSDWKSLPMPRDMRVLEYSAAHAQPPAAYITDIFSNTNFPEGSEIVMGDNKTLFDRTDPTLSKEGCKKCLKKPISVSKPTTTTSTTTVSTTTADYEGSTDEPEVEEPAEPKKRETRSSDSDFTNDPMMRSDSDKGSDIDLRGQDGPLDSTANYTLFVELIPDIEDAESMYSEYVNVLMPAATPTLPEPASAVEIALQATCAVAALILLLMIIFCIRQTRRSRKMPPHAHLEMDSLPPPLRWLPWFGRRQQMAPQAPPDMAPIAKEDLPKAYAERQADSDYGFQKEFELLPECFPDRTTHASEARENQPKNRYPDIKAYDQTRVKLSQIDSINGSDYINANYVMGYQERKQFICAQGPTDTTVNDFWRMIWEQGLELIVMLTNLEEYSKVKCSKYWPDEVRGSRAFGNITVHHVSERRYSDYIVRELRITKQPTNSDGQPIVENNGVAKRNGDVKEANESSAPTSPRETKDTEGRIVKQYHFLMWKDFAAPEHAYSILKFIKRVNEACAESVGVSCVVHCSAGVGRTGTLVALDYLLHQLHHQGHVAVFNTVAELRRQRNFLVQSLKQYVFVYRALVEYAHYGDTEIPACRLRTTIDRLRSTPPQADLSLLEAQFQKIQNSPIPEPLKSCAAGAAEELRSKNRSQEVLPYDRNRVILAPIPGRDFSTYINASFIEAYDNSEGFIITQDPMPSTIMDFWRMVSEHNVTTIVMLSELGEGKCPRYWDDGTAQYEHISVQYEESESCPYYTRRQFRVVNNKSGMVCMVRQLQYQGWPTAPGHVPEVTRGLAELADAAQNSPQPGTMLVHCQLGTERSSLFVALCILICQLRTERRVDICSVARKVRSQRTRTIDTFLQYEFLHRAILNYAELHNLLEDG